ncbi:hypothetical protein [Amycolatopsis sp. NPDC051716]|uniref:hypothetical protein n=1 Tax=Amycolatopsis sp. NPDC051716 TaxID=3155804 RepID=UPI00341283CF
MIADDFGYGREGRMSIADTFARAKAHAAWQRSIRLVSATVLLVLLGGAAVVAVDFLQAAAPRIQSCRIGADSVEDSAWLAPGKFPGDPCPWLSSEYPRPGSVAFHIDEADNTISVRAELTLPVTTYGLIDRIRRGEAVTDPNAFSNAEIGNIRISEYSVMDWSTPTITSTPGQSTVVVATTAVEHRVPSASPRPPAESIVVRGSFQRPSTTVTLTTHQRTVAGISGPLTVKEQSANRLVGEGTEPDGREFTITLASEPPDRTTFAAPQPRLSLPVSVPWSDIFTILGGLGTAVVASAGWLVLVVGGRAGWFGPVAAKPSWRRFERLAGLVVALHFVITAAGQLATVSERISTFLSAAPQRRLIADGVLPWMTRVYPSTTGVVVLLAGLSLCVVPGGVRRWATRGGDTPRHPVARAAGALVVIIGALVLSVVILRLMASQSYLPVVRPTERTGMADPAEAAVVVTLSGFGVLAVLAVAAEIVLVTTAGCRSAGPVRGRYVPCAAVLVPAALGATTVRDAGVLPFLAQWGLLVVGGALLVLGTFQLVSIASLERPLPRVWLAAAVLAALALAIPWRELTEPGAFRGNLLALGIRIDGVLGLLLALGLTITLWRIGRSPVVAESSLRGHRTIGAVAVLTALLGYSLVPTFSAPTVAVALAVSWALFPRTQLPHAHAVLTATSAQRAGMLAGVTAAGSARRSLPGARKQVRDKVAEGTIPFDEGLRRVVDLEKRASAAARKRSGQTAAQLAFGSSFSRRPWKRAVWCATLAAALGAPWSLLALVGAELETSFHDDYPVLAVLTAIGPPTLKWAAYGFTFGYFFPLLRGGTGLSKALWLFVAVALTQTADAAFAGSSADWKQVALSAVQTFAVLMTLGLLADRKVLAERRYGSARLLEVHNLWSMSAWGSSVAVALAAGVATIVIAGLQPFVIGLIQPPPPPVATAPATVGR